MVASRSRRGQLHGGRVPAAREHAIQSLDLSLANNRQYDTVSRLLGWQVRFRWIRRPGNDLYLVYTHNWQESIGLASRRFETLDYRLATKLVYTLRV